MKYFILMAAMIPAVAWGMENAKPIIKMDSATWSTLLDQYYSSKDRWTTTFTHKIDIPEQGAHFELSTDEGFHPKQINLDLEKGTKFITITKDYAKFHIANDTNIKLATLHVLMNAK